MFYFYIYSDAKSETELRFDKFLFNHVTDRFKCQNLVKSVSEIFQHKLYFLANS